MDKEADGKQYWFQGYIYQDLLELASLMNCKPRQAIIKAIRLALKSARQK